MENSTMENNLTHIIWSMPFPFVILTLVYLVANIVISVLINTLLIIIMNSSPSLRTPPNSHLMNICANNLLICVSMIFSILCIILNSAEVEDNRSKVLSGVQLFLVFNSMLQYWGTFASIGYYRHKTIKQPSLSLRKRRQIVSRCITCNWLTSLLLSMICSLSFAECSKYSNDTLDPFRKDYVLGQHEDTTPEQLIIIFILLTVFILGLVIIITSYYSICTMLNITGRFARSRVIPWQQPSTLPSGTTDLTLPVNKSYKPETNNVFPSPYSISAGIQNENVTVHYQKCDHSLAFEDILALENPMLATQIRNHYHQKRTLRQTLSNGSTASTKSKPPDFSDISTGAELERYQMLKNNCILRNQSLKRDRISLSSATKNSLVMLLAYVLCSMPLIVCSIPGALSSLDSRKRVIALLFFRLLFYVNAPVYPIWYLMFSKRVRACLGRLNETILVKFNIRR